MNSRIYLAIDLKSFYASVECIERGLDPNSTNLVVADESRTAKTICLAVSPALKKYGVPGRPRLFEVIKIVKDLNIKRLESAPGHKFKESSCNADMLNSDPSLELSYIAAQPRMAYYMNYSRRIYSIYLRFVSPEDIHVYSIDEVFMDITGYLEMNKCTPHEFAMKILNTVFEETGITATAGIGTNLYLAKIAMDITAKHMEPGKNGVRIASLDEYTYRKTLWTHTPLTDFWRVGGGYLKRLASNGITTMGDIAKCSLGLAHEYYNEGLLYKLVGSNAELLIDHAWGYEPCTIADIKAYKPENNSLSSGQVLKSPYSFKKARLIVREMTEALVLDMVDKALITDQLVLTVGYDVQNLKNPTIAELYKDSIHEDRYGRAVPKHAHGTVNLKTPTSSTKIIVDAVMGLYDKIVSPELLVRRINVAACHVVNEQSDSQYEQMLMFEQEDEAETERLIREKSIQMTMLDIKKRYGGNAILKAMDLDKDATARERNGQIGGHKA